MIYRSTLSYNTANIGGATVTSGSMIDIDNSIFMYNLAQDSGGMMVTFDDRVIVSSSAFNGNIAEVFVGGVMIAFGDSHSASAIVISHLMVQLRVVVL